MSFPSDYVNSIRRQVEEGVESGKVLKECRRAFKNLTGLLKRAKSLGEKSYITSCLTQIKSIQRLLKNAKVGSGSGARRVETASHRVKWDDVSSAFQSRIRTGVITNLKHKDVLLFLSDCLALFKRRILNALRKTAALKVNTALCGEFKIMKADKQLIENKYLNTVNASIYPNTNIDLWFSNNVTSPILNELDQFSEKDSAWALNKILNLHVNINSFNPMRVGSFIELPKKIALKKACINVRNSDELCFAWAIVSALYPVKKNVQLSSSYPNPHQVLNLGGISFPMSLCRIPHFERQNDLSVNVYRLHGKKFEVVPAHLTKNKQEKHINLLLIQDNYDCDDIVPVQYHFVWIKNLSRLLSSQLSRHKGSKFICDRCLHYYYSKEKLEMHLVDCEKHNMCIVPKVPEKENSIVEFKNFNHKTPVPFVIYADTECLLTPVERDTKKNTQEYQKHVPFSVGYYVKCNHDDTLSFYRSYTGPDCMEWFVKDLHEFAENVETVFLCEMSIDMTEEDEVAFRQATHCHICEKPFTPENKPVRDHNHFLSANNYRGAACAECNINFQDSRIVPVFFHNLSSYDGHLIIEALIKTPGRIDLLPINKEKYISFTKQIPENIIKFRFLDSYRFLAAGLDELASYLPEYPILRSEFAAYPAEKFNLLTRKGTFPYEYMDSWERLQDTTLPSKACFYSSLTDSYVSSKDYEYAQKVWTSFECRNMQDYAELYLKTDILLLADVFERFRQTLIKSHGLCPAHSYTLPGYAWQSMLFKTKQKLELLTDMEMITFIENGIRGGLSQCSKRYAEANNKYMPNYDMTKEEVYLMYFDVNNQYGWAMSQYLPFKDFKWMDNHEIENFNIFLKSNNADVGYILEADLEIPEELHDYFSDLPPCPEHRKPKDYGDNKLLATLYKKEKYVIHYVNLKQALNMGAKLTKIHRVLCFQQAPWLKVYIDLNTGLRQNAKNEFEKNLFKLLNNAIFGKSLENIRNHSVVKLVNKWDGRYSAEALISRPEFKSATIISENLVIIEMAKTTVYFNKPVYVGMCILDLAKITIYNFHYDYMTKHLDNCKVLYTDTDSLIYEIRGQNPYELILKDCYKYFDTSDYPKNNIYGIPQVNKKVLGMMSDENQGRIMTHFVGLRSKMYAIKLQYTPEEIEKKRLELEAANKEREEIERAIANLGVTKKSKGVKKCVIKNHIRFEDYVKCLESFVEKPITQNLIRSKKHVLYTLQQTKIGLSPHDDKREILKGSVETLPWGYCSPMETD